MVFMMDSWWNPSVEYQAMDRIHRLGQKRPVKVVKLVVEDSIEDQVSGLFLWPSITLSLPCLQTLVLAPSCGALSQREVGRVVPFVRALNSDRTTSAQETSHDRSGPVELPCHW
jgi:hypothetical protein